MAGNHWCYPDDCGVPTTSTLSHVDISFTSPLHSSPFLSSQPPGADQYSATFRLLSHIKAAPSVHINTLPFFFQNNFVSLFIPRSRFPMI